MMNNNQVLKLNDVCDLIVDCEHKTAPTQETGYPSIRTPNIGKSRLILENVNRVSEDTYTKWTQRAIPQENDLILAREAPVGNVAIIPKNLQVCLGQRTVLIRPNKCKINPHYLVYFLLGDEIQGKFHAYSNGATVHHLNMKDIRNLELPKLPPLPTQQKIASILSAYDELIENNSRQIKILEEMAQLIYREWFVKFKFPNHETVAMVESDLGLIPEGWEVVKVKDIVKRFKSGTKYKEKDVLESGQIPVIDQSKNDFLGFHNNEPDHLASAENPIILFGDHTCKMQLMVENFSLAENVVPFISKYDYLPIYYLYFLVNSLVETKEYKRHWTDLMSKTVVISKSHQTQNFSDIVELLFKQINIYQKENINLRKTRELLLPKLISGEIDVEGLNIKIGDEVE